MKSVRIIVLLLVVSLLIGCQNTVSKETHSTPSADQTSEPAKDIVPFEIPNEMKVYEYDAENILGLCATYVMPGFFACRFTTDKVFAQEYDKDTYESCGFVDSGDVIVPYPSETVLSDDCLYIIVRYEGEELPGICMQSQKGISFSVKRPAEPLIKYTRIDDGDALNQRFIQVTQKYDSKLEKWNEKEELDEPIKIKVVFD